MTVLGPSSLESRPFDFLAVGENSLDEICLTTGTIAPDSKTGLQRRLSLPGGQAMTAAIGVARLGFRSRYVGAIGDDAAGAVVRGALDAESVDPQLVVRPGVPTRSAMVIIDPDGRRSVLEARDPRLNIDSHVEVSDDVLRSARVVLVDATDVALASRAARIAREAGARTMCDVDVVTPEVLKLLESIDIVVVPADFARLATGRDELRESLSDLARNSGALAVVATEGAGGATAWCDGETVHIPAVPMDVVDTTGAGDAFRAGFAAALLRAGPEGGDLALMLRFACQVAALNCRALGAQTALPTAAEVAGPGHLRQGYGGPPKPRAKADPAYTKGRQSGGTPEGEGRV